MKQKHLIAILGFTLLFFAKGYAATIFTGNSASPIPNITDSDITPITPTIDITTAATLPPAQPSPITPSPQASIPTSSGDTAAQNFDVQDFENDPISCPRTITFIDTSAEYAEACQKSNYAEILIGSPTLPSAFQKEIDTFNRETMLPLFRDNRSNANYLSGKGVHDLRIHESCLRDMCQSVFRECTSQNSFNTSDIFFQQQWCQEKVDKLVLVGQSKLKSTLYRNQHRKSQEVTEQKKIAILGRIRTHLSPSLTDIQRQLSRMESKITILINKPATCETVGTC